MSRSSTSASPLIPETDPARRAPVATVSSSPTDLQRLRSLLRAGPLCLIPRRLEPCIAAALDALPAGDLPSLRCEGTPAALRDALAAALSRNRAVPAAMARWLAADVGDKVDLLAAFTGASSFRLRLDVVDDDCCRAFHVDNVRFRLLTTYRGPGTEWIAPRVAVDLRPGETPPPEAIRRLERGSVAILRGSKGATPGQPGVMHRSPPIAGTGIVRLLLAIDEAGRVLH